MPIQVARLRNIQRRQNRSAKSCNRPMNKARICKLMARHSKSAANFKTWINRRWWVWVKVLKKHIIWSAHFDPYASASGIRARREPAQISTKNAWFVTGGGVHSISIHEQVGRRCTLLVLEGSQQNILPTQVLALLIWRIQRHQNSRDIELHHWHGGYEHALSQTALECVSSRKNEPGYRRCLQK